MTEIPNRDSTRSRTGQSTRRDKRAERRWLLIAELHAGQSGFARHALARLAAGQLAYGDQWATRAPDELLRELTEEAADVGAWGVLALQALERDHNLDAHTRRRVCRDLEATLLDGARAHEALVTARRTLADRSSNGGARASRASAHGGRNA